jgi:hypothetical protein
LSLILEALRKLEREKGAPERGFLVVGIGALPERSGRSWSLLGLLALCAALAMVASWPRRTGPSPPPAPPALAPAVAKATVPARPAPAKPVAVPTTRVSQATGSTSATPARARPPAERRFALTAISQQDGHAVAMLNDRLVREGDAFDGIRVIRIGEAEVELEVDGRRLVIGF